MLKEYFSYSPETGDFVWIKNQRPRGKKGQQAGWLHEKTGYKVLSICGVKYLQHRAAWYFQYGVMPANIDHINGNKTDNRIVNLRAVDHGVNMKNLPRRIDNKTGCMGIYWQPKVQRWAVRIAASKKERHVGLFEDRFEALAARKKAETANHYHANHGRLRG